MICFALSPHERLGRAIARGLRPAVQFNGLNTAGLRARVGRIERRVFSDGERYVRPVTPVGGEDVIVIANTGPDASMLLDCCILLRAVRASGARTVTLVIPYFAYARQDRADQSQGPVTATLVAALLEAAGVDRVALVDPHSSVTARAFHVPVEVVDPTSVLVRAAVQHRVLANRKHPVLNGAPIVVAPDAGAQDRARRLAAFLNHAEVVVLEKTRPRPNVARIARLRARDAERIRGSTVILVDDIIDTAGTITAAAALLRAAGAARIVICATHAVLSGPALERLRRAKVDRIIVSDSLPRVRARGVPLRVVSLTRALTHALRRRTVGSDERVWSNGMIRPCQG